MAWQMKMRIYRPGEPGFWDDRNAAQVVLRETTALKSKVDGFKKVENQLDDVEVYWELAMDEEDEGLEPEITAQNGKYGIRLKASAPSIHMMRADITTEVAPIV